MGRHDSFSHIYNATPTRIVYWQLMECTTAPHGFKFRPWPYLSCTVQCDMSDLARYACSQRLPPTQNRRRWAHGWRPLQPQYLLSSNLLYPPDGIPEELHCPALSPVESHPPPIRPSWALSQRTRATACVYRRLRRFELRAKSQKTLDAPVHVLRYSRERHFDLLSVACGSQLRKVSE